MRSLVLMYGLDWSWSEKYMATKTLLLGHVGKWKCRQEAYGNGNRNISDKLVFFLLIGGIYHDSSPTA